MGRIRAWASLATERIDPEFPRRVIDSLFPVVAAKGVHPVAVRSERVGWTNELRVSRDALGIAVVRMGARSTAPGPNGIPGRAFALALEEWGDRARRLFDSCLRPDRFPACWKRACDVLIPKPGLPPDSPKAYRQKCLLDETGKLFERAIAARL